MYFYCNTDYESSVPKVRSWHHSFPPINYRVEAVGVESSQPQLYGQQGAVGQTSALWLRGQSLLVGAARGGRANTRPMAEGSVPASRGSKGR